MKNSKNQRPAVKSATPARERVMVLGPTGKRRFVWRDKV